VKKEQVLDYYDVLKPLFKSVVTHKTADEYIRSISNHPRGLITLFAAYCCDAEIRNGGLLQLFYNPTGMCVPEAVEGYQSLGMSKCASIVQLAAQLLGDPYPREREDRQEALLRSTGKSVDEVTEIARNTAHPFLGFREVTKELDLDALTHEYYKFADAESGGFEQAAERYVATL
jgi:hypothetical protein